MKMKKYYLLAIAAITTLFTACNSDDDVIGGEETRGVVKTEFTISFPAKAVGGTRMTATTVQKDGNFRGIQDIKLYPFTSKVASITTSTSLPSVITLGGGTTAKYGASSTTANEIAASGALFTGNNAHLYKDIEIAVGTKAFMFYGKAIPDGNDDFANGTLSHNLSESTTTTLNDITFSPAPIYGGNLGDNATAIANYLKSIANVSGWETSDQSNVVLGTLYHQFINMKAGSWASVKGAVQQLYNTLWNKTFIATADNTLRDAIKTAILANANVSDSNNDGTLEFATNSYGNFPADISLPDGAIYMSWNSTSKTFEMITGTKDNTGMNITALNKYVYPAPLYYRVLSDIRTAAVPKLKYYDDTAGNTDYQDTWAKVINEYGSLDPGVNDEVKFTTRSIALVNQVQYAVGRLDVTVKAGAATLPDNRAALDNYTTNENIDLYRLEDPENSSSTKIFDKFPVTGILVGNQNPVDYLFHLKSNTDDYTIYDKTMPANLYLKNADPVVETETIHTLVFETADAVSDDDANAIVKIAVEFENNSGQLFVGMNGEIIYPGSKFYLVGTFDPNKNTTVTDANSNVIKKAFLQDYITTANLTINNLQKAYNTMPDLRAPQLELGLSVNLNWLPGITQAITIE